MPELVAPVIVPLDGSKNSEEAIPVAVTYARLIGAPLHVVHVIDSERPLDDAALEKSAAQFDEYARSLLEAPVSASLLKGSPANAILEAAAGASAIVIATHGRGGIKAALVGSVADKVVRGARIPVLAVPLQSPPAIERGPILVAVDGSGAAERGLDAARTLADAMGVKLLLLRAYASPPAASVEFGYYAGDMTDSLRAGAEDYLATVARPGDGTLAAFGNPADAIAQAVEAQRVSLVVMTSHGKGFAHRVALGSVTDRAMHSLSVPLLIVPAAE